jgi:hypothetical protein
VSAADVLDISGIVTSGVGAGGLISGSIWEDPVIKTGGSAGYNTGYELDVPSALACADGSANSGAITKILAGGGGTSTNSLAGFTASGIQITMPFA